MATHLQDVCRADLDCHDALLALGSRELPLYLGQLQHVFETEIESINAK